MRGGVRSMFYITMTESNTFNGVLLDHNDTLGWLEVCVFDSQLMSRVNRGLIHNSVILQSEVLQLPIVPECPPLCVHAHVALLPFH